MERPYAPAPGIARFLAGTPPILGLAAAEEACEADRRGRHAGDPRQVAGPDRAADRPGRRWLAPLGFTVGSPRAGARRGSQVALRHPDAWRIAQALVERARAVPDFRPPDVVRLGVAPLYTRFVDVWDALERLRRLVAAAEHEAFAAAPGRVT